jgi:RecA-family ATPase
VDELICKGDITMMIGEPGVGKSWLSMSLAIAVAEGTQQWLGRRVDAGNHRVLYVDEENPEALIPHRLRKLGLTERGAENVRYLHRQGVRLDRYPDRILDEALDWEPTLIVLDSLTRLHTKDENNAGEVAALFNDGISPLARETGATTLILHHVNKGESNSSFSRARGSGDLSASIDSGLDVRPSDTGGGIYVAHYKSRWIAEGTIIRASITDTPEGNVRVIVNDRHAF